MKEQILQLLKILQQSDYDNEAVHGEYDSLLEEFIMDGHYNDPELVDLVKRLINREKSFWYA